METIYGITPFALGLTLKSGETPFSFPMGCASFVIHSIPKILYGYMRTDEEVHSRLKPQGANLLPFMGSLGARWPPKGASREAAGSSFSDTEKCPAFSTGHPTTTLTVRHTYNMAVCKTPDATTLTVCHTYIMRAMSPGSQAVTNAAVLTGDAPKLEGSALPLPVTGASTSGWKADETPAEILGYGAAPLRIPP